MTTPQARAQRAYVALNGPLDTDAVSHLLDSVRDLPDAAEVVIDCSGVSTIDPVGAARLWIVGRELEGAGRVLRLLSLPERLLRRLRMHPIIRFAELHDAVFTDPFAAAGSSR